MGCDDRIQAYSGTMVDLLHTRKQGVSQIRVETRFVALMCDTEALQIEDASIVCRPWSSDSGQRTAGDSTSACGDPQPGQQGSTGNHGQSPPLRNVRVPGWISKGRVNCTTSQPVVNLKYGQNAALLPPAKLVFPIHCSLKKKLNEANELSRAGPITHSRPRRFSCPGS
jgi:hypothetical protein